MQLKNSSNLRKVWLKKQEKRTYRRRRRTLRTCIMEAEQKWVSDDFTDLEGLS